MFDARKYMSHTSVVPYSTPYAHCHFSVAGNPQQLERPPQRLSKFSRLFL